MPTVRRQIFAIWPTDWPTAPTRRHHHGLAGSRMATQQPKYRLIRHSEHAVGGRISANWIDLAQRRPAANGVFLPAQPVLDDVAGGEAGMVRFHHLADRAAGHHLAQPDRCGIGCRVAHAAALVRIEREVDHAYQHLARPRLGHGDFLDAEIGFGRLGRRPAHKNDAAMGIGDHDHSDWQRRAASARPARGSRSASAPWWSRYRAGRSGCPCVRAKP